MKLVANGPGIGDSMFLSAVAHECKAQRPDEDVTISCAHPELYTASPDVDKLEMGWEGPGARSFPELDNQAQIREHNVQFMCRKMGLEPPKLEDVRQWYWHEEALLAQTCKPPHRYVTISPWAGRWTRNKDWQRADWETLVERLSDRQLVVLQLGAEEDVRILGTNAQAMGRPLPMIALLMQHALCHICVVTGTMHMASAIGAKCVAIFGGREDPNVTGYWAHTKLYVTKCGLECAPCWKVEPCPIMEHGVKPCMARISVEDVLEAVDHAIDQSD